MRIGFVLMHGTMVMGVTGRTGISAVYLHGSIRRKNITPYVDEALIFSPGVLAIA